jgi:hypothetical protein
MAKAKKPAKRRVPGGVSSGRVTPKGGHGPASGGPLPSRRYTPPVPMEMKVAPAWVPYVMFGLLGLGMLVIVSNYLGVLPGGTSNLYLLVGLGAILGGIIAATQYR